MNTEESDEDNIDKVLKTLTPKMIDKFFDSGHSGDDSGVSVLESHQMSLPSKSA